jgi:N utilization substance protein A
VVLPRNEQIPSERYRRGDHVRAVVKSVEKTNRGLEIIVSRADPQVLIRLFELEVPEIYDGIIEIKDVAREPGERAKIAVISHDKRIDALGACVGMKGIRIQAISKEMNNEKIDVINWNGDAGIYISRSLSPARVYKVIVDQNKKKAIAVLEDDQMSLAIGRGGQNRRLASKLTGYDIEIIKQSEYKSIMESKLDARPASVDDDDEYEGRPAQKTLTSVPGFTAAMIRKLTAGGISSPAEVLEAGMAGLVSLPGVGEKSAQKILNLIKESAES